MEKSIIEQIYDMDIETLRQYCKSLLGRNAELMRELKKSQQEKE